MNFKIQGSIIMLMTSAWLWNQNKIIFLCFYPECLFAYLIGYYWHEFLGFWGNKHLEPNNASCVMTSSNKDIFVYLNVDCICFVDNFCWLVFLGFCRTTYDIYEPIITRRLIAYWHLQNSDISLFFWLLIASFYFIDFVEATRHEPTIRLMLIA